MKKINKKELLIIIISFLISLVAGIISKDMIIGTSILFTSLLCSYYASIGKKVSYIFGIINYLIMSYVFLMNNLYGLFFFAIFIFTPLNISGFINWKNNEDEKNSVKARQFTLKNSILIVSSCILGSFVLGYILTLIPSQNLAYMDAASNCINLCGVILMVLRFKEAWWIWLVNNIIDLIIWIIMFINNGTNSFMMLLSSISYLVINIYGIVKWSIKIRKEKSNI